MPDPEIEDLLLFCRSLREHGLTVTPSEVVAAVTAVRLIDSNDREEVFLSLRSVLTTRVDDFPIFAELFEIFWKRLPQKLVERDHPSNSSSIVRHSPKTRARGLEFFLQNWTSS